MSAETAVQGALFGALAGVGLTIYDVAPQAADGSNAGVFPYVEIGAIVLTRWDTKADTGFDFVARIHTRSRSGSMKETKDIQGQIYDRLHLGDLTLAGYVLTLLQFQNSDVSRVADSSFHGVSEFRGMIEKA